MSGEPHSQAPATAAPESVPTAASFSSDQLFGDRRTIVIEHCGQHYTLRITRENKLILTK